MIPLVKNKKSRVLRELGVLIILFSILFTIPIVANATSDTDEDITLTQEELNWLEDRNAIYVGYFNNYLPYCGTDKDGKPTGLLIDVFEEMLDEQNLINITHVEYKEYRSYSEMVKAVTDGEIDAFFPAHEFSEEEQNGEIALTNPVITSGMVYVYKGSFSQDKYDSIALTSGNGLVYDYVKHYYPDSEVIYCDSIDKCLEAVKKGNATGTIINGLRIDIMTKDNRFSRSLSMLQLNNDSPRCIGVDNDNEILLSIINKGLNSIDPNYAYSQSYRYLTDLYKTSTVEKLKTNSGWIVLCALVLIVTVAHFAIRDSKRNTDRVKEIQSATDVNLALSKDFLNVFYVHAKAGTVDVIKMEGFPFEEAKKGNNKLNYDEACNTYIKERVFADDVDMMTKTMALTNVLSHISNEKSYSGTYRVWLDCAIHYYQFKCVAIEESLDFIAGFQCVDELVAEELRKNELLQAANEAKTTFLFNMSHDVRTPMNAIIGFTDLIKKHIDDKEACLEYVGKIQTASDFLLSMMNNVLEMARIESGKYSIEESYWDAKEFNDNLYSVFGEQMRRKNITFTRTVNVQHTDVLCDATKLREVFLNIISNSLKFTTEGGSISMDLEEIPSDRPGYALYKTVISDDGIGISEDFLPHIFEEFSRERNTTDSKISGTGLGMPIVKKLVDIMGGSIQVDSNVGEGTTVTVIVPHRIASELDKNSCDRNALQIEKGHFKGRRILLAEDNELNAEIAMAILEEYGFEIDRAVDGADCVEKLDSVDAYYYDIILMDIQMPIMNGYQATETIRKMPDPVKRDIPIVAMTANTYEEDRQQAYSVGMNGHIGKPIKAETLVQNLKDILE